MRFTSGFQRFGPTNIQNWNRFFTMFLTETLKIAWIVQSRILQVEFDEIKLHRTSECFF